MDTIIKTEHKNGFEGKKGRSTRPKRKRPFAIKKMEEGERQAANLGSLQILRKEKDRCFAQTIWEEWPFLCANG